MGNPLPANWPPLLPDKWYCIESIQYKELEGPSDCDSPISGAWKCCVSTEKLIQWGIDLYGCTIDFLVCSGLPDEDIAEDYPYIDGPYDTQGHCIDKSECIE